MVRGLQRRFTEQIIRLRIGGPVRRDPAGSETAATTAPQVLALASTFERRDTRNRTLELLIKVSAQIFLD
jgi:hypothetical protein